MQITVHPKTPLSRLSKEDLIKEVKASRYSFREIQAQVQSLTNGMTETVTNEVGEGLYFSIENNPPEDNFLELIWKEQKKAFQSNPKGMRWHPMMIRFAIFLQYQSPRAYEAIRESGVLKLPNKSTLKDYTNVITPATGFQPHMFEELRKIAADLPSEKRFVALLHDENKIKSDLVYDRRSGQVIGFTNPNTWTFNEDESMKIATHVLVFMVVDINSHIKMSIGHFPTRTSTADELYPLFWSAVAYLEMTCELKVITSTSDKASANQRLYRIHKVGNEPVVFKTKNVFTEEDRYIYFISDAPHLVKTIRNNVYRSKTGGSRYVWNNGRFILWFHVMDIYNDDTRGQLYRTKLTHDHVYLTPSSTMSVKLAVQVLSNSVAQVMRAYYGPEVSETARLFSLVN
ncbi:uncharacterized protein LOC125652376 isoform X1 [Ostrea edulis]|uniref:uncharacterized protein LOC125652376 isoform X1 n=1 Tax=Ostrea edulis TaxID=37623 RepID=UPI0024AFD48D|nr:uncharacterized protein LOC125652376 isoform X1 [Ostrea edulis]XP_056020981.1 uncharacterized protein LOC125652376 isoform X1 [Ostrea edulis]